MKYHVRRRSTVFIFTLVLMAFLSQGFHGQIVTAGLEPEQIAQNVYNGNKDLFDREDIRQLLPDVLVALKSIRDPDILGSMLHNPDVFKQHLPNTDDRFMVLLREDLQVSSLFKESFLFFQLLSNPKAIDALLALLKPVASNQVKIDSAFVNVSRYGTLRMTGSPLHIGDSVSVGTSHTLIFTVIDAEGNPVPGLPLSFRLQPLNGTAASGTFNPATVITNQTGSAHVQVTFGPEPGDLRLLIDVNTQEIVDVVELELTRGNNTRVHKVTVKGIEHKFARIGTTQTLVFTATDANGQPVEGEELTFGFRGASGSAATATFDSTTATTDENGEARTQITFGPEPGGIHLTVQSGPAVEQVNITSSQINLGSQVQGTFTGLQVGDSVDVGSTHTLVFTAKDMRGRPVSGLPIAFTFSGIPIELAATFDPETATTDRNGKVQTEITFGQEPGDFELIVSIDAQQVIVFSEPEFSLEATNIANLKVQGMENGFAQPSSSINLVLTATDARGRPVANEELVFGGGVAPYIGPSVVFEPVLEPSRATAVFEPAKVKTNNRGKAQTRVTFGPEPGRIRLTVRSGVIIHSIMLDLEPYGTLSLKGLQVGDAVKVKSTHSLVFTATNDAGEPVPWLPLRFNALSLDGAEVGTTFKPARVVTNKNGKARTSITLGAVHGEIRLIAEVDSEQIVELLPPKITLDDSKVAKLTFEGIEQGFARVGTTRNLTVTARNKNGRPVSGVNLAFRFRSPPESKATVTFSQATVKTDKKGQAQTEVTFGENPGSIRFVVQPLDRVTIHSFTSDFNLSLLTGELMSESFTIGDAFKIDSTHNFVFTATSASGDPVPWLPIRFDALYLDGTEAGVTFAPATTTTNKNGKARTRITFGGDPGDIRLIAEVDREQIVEFYEPELALDGSSVAQLTVKGIEQGFARVGTKRNLVFTATDENNDPVSGVEFAFGFEGESDSNATAAFDPVSATTNENGKSQTKVTFGSKPGGIRFTVKYVSIVQPDPQVRVVEVSTTRQDIELTVEGLELNTLLPADSTHALLFTVKNADGQPLQNTELTFTYRTINPIIGADPATVTFNPPQALTNQHGEVETRATFGPNSGDVGIYASIQQPSYFYWVTGTVIQSANQDGSNYMSIFNRPNPVMGFALDPERGQLYWVEQVIGTGENRIGRANLDGSNQQDIVTGFTNPLYGFTLDIFGGKLYWSYHSTDGLVIQRADFDGSNIENVVTEKSGEVWSLDNLAVDPVGRKIYWVRKTRGNNISLSEIQRVNLDGSNLETVINPNISAVDGQGFAITKIALDVERGKVYWLETKGNAFYSLRSANLDGGNIQDLSEIGITPYPSAFTLDSASGKIYWSSDNLYSADLSGNNIETIVPYSQRNGRSSSTTVILARGLALNTKIVPTRVEEPTMSRNVWIRDSHLTLSPTSPNEPDIDVKIEEDLSSGFLPGSKHKLTFIFVRKSGEPLSGESVVDAIHDIGYLPTLTTEPDGKEVPQLHLTVNPRSSTTAMFSPSTITPDENGKAETYVTFGQESGVIDIDVLLPVVAFQNVVTKISREGIGSGLRMIYEQVQDGNHIPGGSQKYIFTAMDQTGEALSGYQLDLRVDPSSSATATLNPSLIDFDENGKAEIEVINGPQGGILKIIATLKRPDLYLKDLSYTFSDEVHPDLEVKMLFGGTSPKAHSSIEVGDELRGGFPIGSDTVNVWFSVKKGELSISGVELVLTATSDQPSVTFSPTTINTTESVSTTMTVGKDVSEISIQVKVGLHQNVKIKGSSGGYVDYPVTYNIAGSEDFLGKEYPLGSKHKVVITVNKDGKAVQDLKVTLKATSSYGLEHIGSKSTPTATFDPAEVITDENGQAETYLTFGDVPGDISINSELHIPRERLAWFYIANPGFSIGGIEIDITFNGESGTLSETSDFSHPLSTVEPDTPKKLVLQTKNPENPGTSVPNVDIVFSSFSSDPDGSVTFQPNKVRTNEEGQAVTYITFGAGQKDVHIYVKVNMVFFNLKITPDPSSLSTAPHPLLPIKAGATRHIERIEIYVDGKLVPDYLLGKDLTYLNPRAEYPLGSDDPEKPFTTSFVGILPLNAEAYFRFRVNSPGALYTISTQQTVDIKLDQGYATSAQGNPPGSHQIGNRGEIRIGMSTGSEPGISVINLNPLTSAQLKGTVNIYGVDDDPIFDSYFKDELSLQPININSQKEFFKHWQTLKFTKEDKTLLGNAYDGLRVEIEIKTRKILSTGVETGVFAKLYEGDSASTLDLEDINCQVFVTPWVTPLGVGHTGRGWRLPDGYIQNPTNLPALHLINVTVGSAFRHLLDDLVKEVGRNFLLHRRRSGGHEIWPIAEHIGIADAPHNFPFPDDESGGDRVIVVFDLQLAPIDWTPVFSAPTAVIADHFSISDVNLDGQVNATDLILVSNALEQVNLSNLRVDVNSDGIFTIADLIQVAQHLGQSIGSNTSAAFVVPKGLTYATVERWIDSARAADDGSLVFQQGIANLEFLLTLIIPEETTLLTNYPNPFNPETWIPYHLAKSTEVTLDIYAVDGRLVRTLALGHQPAGFYQSKSRAAYWDGRNNVGERVASGIYFYTLTAGDFMSTRKMLIMK